MKWGYGQYAGKSLGWVCSEQAHQEMVEKALEWNGISWELPYSSREEAVAASARHQLEDEGAA